MRSSPDQDNVRRYRPCMGCGVISVNGFGQWWMIENVHTACSNCYGWHASLLFDTIKRLDDITLCHLLV